MLRTAANDNPTDWPNRLPALLAADRMTVHKVTQVTPNMAMLGKEVLFPTTLIANPTEEPLNTTVPFVESFTNYETGPRTSTCSHQIYNTYPKIVL